MVVAKSAYSKRKRMAEATPFRGNHSIQAPCLCVWAVQSCLICEHVHLEWTLEHVGTVTPLVFDPLPKTGLGYTKTSHGRARDRPGSRAELKNPAGRFRVLGVFLRWR